MPPDMPADSETCVNNPAPVRKAQWVKLALRLLVTVVLLWLVLAQIELDQFGKDLAAVQWRYLPVLWGLTGLFFLIRSYTLQIMLKRLDCPVGLGTLFGASALTGLNSLILPGMLGTGVKWYVLTKGTGKGAAVLSAMLYNQLIIQAVMTFAGLAALSITRPAYLGLSNTFPSWILPVVCGGLTVAVALLTALLLSRKTGGYVVRILELLVSPLPERIRTKVHNVFEHIKVFQAADIVFHMKAVTLTALAGLGIGIAVYVFAAKAANITVPVTVLVWLCTAIFVLSRLPISISNLGVREFTLVQILALHAVTEPAALLMSMALFSTALFMAAIGAVYQFYWSIHPPGAQK